MKPMNRSFLPASLSVLLALGFAGCGGDDDVAPGSGGASAAGNGGHAGLGGGSAAGGKGGLGVGGSAHGGAGAGGSGASGGVGGTAGAGGSAAASGGSGDHGGTTGATGGEVNAAGSSGRAGVAGTGAGGGGEPGGEGGMAGEAGSEPGTAGTVGSGATGGSAGTVGAGGSVGSGGNAGGNSTGGIAGTSNSSGGIAGTSSSTGGIAGTSSSTGGIAGTSSSSGGVAGDTMSGGGTGGASTGTGGTSGDACAGITCSGHGVCSAPSGSAQCTCDSGYASPPNDATSCNDVNECVTANGGCDSLTTCTNSPGSFTCGACPAGYTGTGATGCVPVTCSGVPDPTCACIKVSLDGDDTNGALTGGVSPFATVQAAIDFAAAHRTHATSVCLAEGTSCGSSATYLGPNGSDLRMQNGISVYGAYESTTWTQCANQGTTLAPTTASGVVFGSDVQSATTLAGVMVHLPPTPTTTGVTISGARGAKVEVAMEFDAGPTNLYGVDVSGGADAAISVSFLPSNPDYSPYGASNEAMGIRVVDSRVDITRTQLVAASSGTAIGLSLSNASGSTATNSLFLANYPGPAGEANVLEGLEVRQGGASLVLDGSTFLAGTGTTGGTSEFGLDIQDVAQVSASNVTVQAEGGTTVVGLRMARGTLLFDGGVNVMPGIGTPTGVVLEDASGSNLVFEGLQGLYADTYDAVTGIAITGDRSGMVIHGGITVQGLSSATGIELDSCSGTAPDISGATFNIYASSSSGKHTNVAATDCTGTCNYSNGAYDCSVCPQGYVNTAQGCQDIDECATNNGGCDSLTTCTNTPGSYVCGSCPPGYGGNGATGCISECQCQNGGTCVASGNGYVCQCPAGIGGANCDHLYTTVSASGIHSCALTTLGTIDCWGDNSNGEASAPSGTFSTLEAGNESTCAIGAGNLIQCFGLIEFGNPNPPSGPFVALSSGNTFNYCAIRSDGSVACWGADGNGQSDPPSDTFTQLSTYYNGSAGLRTDGSIEFWGDTSGFTTKPGPYIDMVLGEAHVCAIKPDHTLECFNNSQFNQTPPSGTYQSLTVDTDTNCALATDGTVACWGSNTWGDGSLGKAVAPSGKFLSISLAAQHGCGVRTDHSIACWGNPAYAFPSP
jgi:hypothetical protein